MDEKEVEDEENLGKICGNVKKGEKECKKKKKNDNNQYMR